MAHPAHSTPLWIAAALTALLAGCSPMPGANVLGQTVTVQGVGSDDLLKLRGGPSLEYRILAGLPDGTELTLKDCVTELGQEWCHVALTRAPGLSGYVSADYLSGR